MKFILLFFVLISFETGYSQHYAAVDSIVSTYNSSFSRPSVLANLVMKDFTSDESRVRAIYSWVVDNVNYSLEESDRYPYTYRDEGERLVKEKKYQDKLATRVISKNIAVCEGYSVLFKRLCDLMGIKCHLITGFGKSETGLIGRYSSNHSWNMIEINSQKYLIDATWGKGNKPGSKEQYFMPNPLYFINDHYPDDFKNSLLQNKVDKKTFINWPLVCESGYLVSDLVMPRTGTLKINPSKTENVSFKFKWNSDKVIIDYYINQKFYEVFDYTYENGVISFDITLEPNRAKELLIYIDSQAFLGYKLKQ